MQRLRVDISPKILLYAILIFGASFLFWEIRNIIVILFIAFILNAGLRPIVDALESRKIPRGLSITLIYIVIYTAIFLIGIIVVNEFVHQLQTLADALPAIFTRLTDFVKNSLPFLSNLVPLLETLQQEIGTVIQNAVNSEVFRGLISTENIFAVISQTIGAVSTVGELLVSIVTITMVSIYMLQKKDKVYKGIISLLPDSMEKSASKLMKKIEASLGSWLVGQFSLMFIVGFITYFIVQLPGFFDPTYTLGNYALPIALVAGLLEALPNIGPTITLILSSILALGTSGVATVIYIAVTFTGLQIAEGMYIVPQVMKKAVGIDPILTILGILAAFQLGEVSGVGGVTAAILAIPVIAVVQIAVVEVSREYKRLERQRPKLV